MASTSSGNKQLGVGFVNLKELHAKGSDLSMASIPLKGADDERRVGTVDVSLAAAEAMHRATSATGIRLCVGALELPLDMKHDANLAQLVLEIDLHGLAPAENLRTKARRRPPSETAHRVKPPGG